MCDDEMRIFELMHWGGFFDMGTLRGGVVMGVMPQAGSDLILFVFAVMWRVEFEDR